MRAAVSNPAAGRRIMRMSGYQWAGWLCVLAVVAAGGWYLFALTKTTYQVEAFQRVGWVARPFALDHGSYTLWIEGDSLSATRYPAADYRKELFPHLVDVASKAEVAVTPARSQVFNTGEREGRSLWRFTAPHSGTYSLHVDTHYREDVNVPSADDFAISRGRGLRWPVRPWLGVIFVVGVAMSAALAIGTWARRRRDLRRYLNASAR